MNRLLTCFTLIILAITHSSCIVNSKKKPVVTVFAAASVTDVVNNMAEDFKSKTGISLRVNFASSGILARQIESGADCDYYISASKSWMDYVDSLKLMNEISIEVLAQNRMALIVPLQSAINELSQEDLYRLPELFEGRISIGDPSHVPAGKYAHRIIEKNNWKNALENRYLPAKDVRDALFMVEMNEVEMGMVYKSDALKSKKVRMVYEFPKEDCFRISYFGISSKENDERLNQFVQYLHSEEARNVWVKHGFVIE
eukprot:TRINITY_DN10212_c0_g3_i1.p2 TRINITY_DN10212_c0_g3~~TRINITY_DN10212_c0_g3_i1.p2  ORF type:complete len:257 (+),score=37.06 TRINITY_DN10212_c0_g3_i1:3754-4524(+)